MRRRPCKRVVLMALAFLDAGAAEQAALPTIATVAAPSSTTLVRSISRGNLTSSLWEIVADGYSDGPIVLLDIHARSAYDTGYVYGAMQGNASLTNYETFMAKTFPSKVVRGILERFLDWQYARHVKKSLPREFVDELRGIQDAGTEAGLPSLGTCVQRTLTISAIATGDVEKDILYLIRHEIGRERIVFSPTFQTDVAAAHSAAGALASMRHRCSMFGVWGSRTLNGALYTGRNLDWQAETGLSRHKLIMVVHRDGQVPYAAVSFAGLPAAITGVSAAGITVHEAGNDNKAETLDGFIWGLRLRYIMANARNLTEAGSMWNATVNGCGYLKAAKS